MVSRCISRLRAPGARERDNRRLAEESLRSSEQRLATIVASADDGIVTVDGPGRIESFNPAAERIFGYAAREVLGRPLSLLVAEGTIYPVDLDLWREAHGSRDLLARRKDGE
jgi:PAS domain S-box-containing protein